jgi:hypothetical protein
MWLLGPSELYQTSLYIARLPGKRVVADGSQVYSNTRFFKRAGGRRREGAFVALFTFAFFFVSFRVLPYVPTIQASTLVLFIGIELTVEALWESSAMLIWHEWSIVASTTLACTFIGFAPGIGVGLAFVVILQYWHHLCETVGYCPTSIPTKLSTLGTPFWRMPSTSRLSYFAAPCVTWQDALFNALRQVDVYSGEKARLKQSVLDSSGKRCCLLTTLVSPAPMPGFRSLVRDDGTGRLTC